MKLGLRPPDLAEKTQLARYMGKSSWNPEHAELFPTLGSITMDEPMRAMRERFKDDLTREQQYTMWSLKLLERAGILPYTHARLQGILSQIFHRTLYLDDALERLADEDFIRRPGWHDPVQPEPAYLQDAVTAYIEGRKPEDDFPQLGKVLEGIGDVEGLLYLGDTYLESLKQAQASFDIYKRALALRPKDPAIWRGKGYVLRQLGRLEEALAAYEQALTLRPDNPAAIWHDKGIVLEQLGQPEEALAAYEQALTLRPDYFHNWHHKGIVLWQLRRPEEALAAFEQALTLRSKDPAILYCKSGVLRRLGLPKEALAAFEQALALRPDDSSTWHDKGTVLRQLGRPEEALAAFEQALIYYDNAITLQQQRIKGARHWKVADDLASTLMDKGRTLTHLQRLQDADACYNEGIGWRERLVDAGVAHLTPTLLEGLGRRFALHQQLTAWDGAARDVMQALTYATPLLHAHAPSRLLRAEWERFQTQLQALSASELVQLYDALGDQAARVQEGIALPPDPREILLSSQPHPGANPAHAAELNRQYQQALADWQALSWLQRRKIKKPVPPSGI